MAAYTYKGSQIVTPFTIFSNQPVYEVQTVSLKTQRSSQNVQRWEISFTTVNTEETAADMLVGLVDNIDTVETTVMPQLPSAQLSTSTVTLRPNVLHVAGSTSIVLNTTSTLAGDILKKGTFVQFDNHDKIYMVTTETILSGATSTIGIFPALRQDITTSTNLNINGAVSFKHLRSIDTMSGITFNDGVLSSPGTITLIEAL